MSENLKEYGLSGPTYGFLFFLLNKDGITEKEITDLMLVDKATTTRAVSRLVKEGYVRKQGDPADKRVQRIHITKKASSLKPRLRQVKKDWMELVLGDLDESERTMLMELLTRIEDNLQRTYDGEDR
jgi:DNA-binding MarR family transcriptional regulator